MSVFDRLKAEWVWLPQDEEKVNQYVEFRHEFTLEEMDYSGGALYISVDTEYAVWINGVFVNCGQYDDYPDKKIFDTLPVGTLLKSGKNTICIQAYYQGESSFQYIKGTPGVVYAIEGDKFHIASGNNSMCRESNGFKSGPVDKITGQLSYSFEYNAVGSDNWLLCNYIMDSQWIKPVITTISSRLLHMQFNERPIKKLLIRRRIETHIISQGVFRRNPKVGKTTAQRMQTDYLSYRLPSEIFTEAGKIDFPSSDGVGLQLSEMKTNDGVYIVIDLGREEAGLLEFKLRTAKGTIIEIAYGEHLDDLRVRASVGGRNFAAFYTCCDGLQEFTYYFKRIAGRYLQFHISNISKEFIIYYAGLKPVEYPIEMKGAFLCPDHLLNKIYDVSVRTAHLCMHEHYEDTPWREQALYGMDSRMQALVGYYCFGEYDFPISSFKLLGDSMRADGYLAICAPAEFDVTIPSFCMAWIMELGDYLLFSGNIIQVKKLLPKVKTMMDSFLANQEENLMKTPVGKRYWNFYEWTSGLDDTDAEKNAMDAKYRSSLRLDAPLNLFLCMALEAAINMAGACGDFDTSQRYETQLALIKKEFHERFWDETENCYKTYIGEVNERHYAELVQALAICSGACPDNITPLLMDRLAKGNNGLVKTSLSYSLYKYQALLQDPQKHANTVFNSIAKDWGSMLYKGATSFWETLKGADDFCYGGSLSHGWSAIPVYFFYAYILGVMPLEPGFKTFKVEPAFWVINKASGKVPTPHGNIEIDWEACREGVKINIKYPDGITMKKSLKANYCYFINKEETDDV